MKYSDCHLISLYLDFLERGVHHSDEEIEKDDDGDDAVCAEHDGADEHGDIMTVREVDYGHLQLAEDGPHQRLQRLQHTGNKRSIKESSTII